MIVSFVAWPLADEARAAIAICELFPEFVGHGDDGDEAAEDLREQLEAITWQ